MLNDDYNIVNIFRSIKEIKNALKNSGDRNLYKALENGTKFCGYYWKREYILDEDNKKANGKQKYK